MTLRSTGWLRALGADPGSPTDLQPVIHLIDDARVVALGEAAHNITEFLLLRNELLRLLADLGFTAIVTESGFAEALTVDAFVQGGSGDAATVAREAISYRFGECAPAVEQLEWLREHNRCRADSAAVHWYGMDLPGDSTSPEPALRACLSRIAPAPGDDELLRLADLGRRSRAAVRFEALSSAGRDTLYHGIDDVIHRAATDGDPVARHCANALAAFVAQSRWPSAAGDAAVHPRDAFMADTVRWVLERHERVLVCAHNAHVQRSPLDGRPMLGGLLSDRLGRDLRVIGQTYGAGPEVHVLERSDRPFDWEVELVERQLSPGSLEHIIEHELADRCDASAYLVLPQAIGAELRDGSADAFDAVVHHRRVHQVPGAFERLREDLEAT